MIDSTVLSNTETKSSDKRSIAPYLPTYDRIRLLLPIWRGKNIRIVRECLSSIESQRGTPQTPVDWSDPDTWISERLNGSNRELASEIWRKTDGRVNPRYTYGAWIFCTRHRLLLPEPSGDLRLTESGQDFLHNKFGKTEFEIDSKEGVFKLLRLIGDSEPCQQRHLLPMWSSYVEKNYTSKSVSTFKNTLYRRLVNLHDRNLTQRQSQGLYELSDQGRAYLREYAGQFPANESDEIHDMVRQHQSTVRNQLLELISKIDPFEFEQIIKQLLEEMGYQDTTVTSKSGDAGVDVVANIELGITSVREVVQVKRHSRTIQRHVLDALRGVLHRFDAVRGSIITTSKFSKGAENAAFERGAAPITLINGEKLLDLLIKYELGIEKQKIEVLRIDTEFFSNHSTN